MISNTIFNNIADFYWNFISFLEYVIFPSKNNHFLIYAIEVIKIGLDKNRSIETNLKHVLTFIQKNIRNNHYQNLNFNSYNYF